MGAQLAPGRRAGHRNGRERRDQCRPVRWAAPIDLRGNQAVRSELAEPRLERAIGVVYRPDTERASHYFHARLPDQFDAMLHFDRTRALEPLERAPT